VDQEKKNGRRAVPKQDGKPKNGTMSRIIISTIIFGIILTGCFAPPAPPMLRADPEGFRDIKWGTEITMLEDTEEVEQDKSSGRELA
jgi:hypothetical protein